MDSFSFLKTLFSNNKNIVFQRRKRISGRYKPYKKWWQMVAAKCLIFFIICHPQIPLSKDISKDWWQQWQQKHKKLFFHGAKIIRFFNYTNLRNAFLYNSAN